MRGKSFYLIFLIFILSIISVSAEVRLVEGYERIEGEEGYTIYNEQHIKKILGNSYPQDGELFVEYYVRGKKRDFGFLSGSVITSEFEKDFNIDGKYLSPATRKDFIKVEGPDFKIDASNKLKIKFVLEDATFTFNNYTFLCKSDDCMMTATMTPTKVYLKVEGDAVAVHNQLLEKYQKKEEVNEQGVADISNLDFIRVASQESLVISAVPIGKATFDGIKIESLNKVLLKKTIIGGSVYDSVKASNAGISYADLPVNLYLMSKNTQHNVKGLYLDIKGKENLEIVRGSVFVFPEDNQVAYDICAGHIEGMDEGLGKTFENGACVYFSEDEGVIKFKPKVTSIKVGKSRIKVPFTVRMRDSAKSPYREIIVEEFDKRDKRSTIMIRPTWNGYKRMVFNSKRVLVNKGQWYDYGRSFYTYPYDAKTDQHKVYHCDIETKECYLNDVKVSGPSGIAACTIAESCEDFTGDKEACESCAIQEGKVCKYVEDECIERGDYLSLCDVVVDSAHLYLGSLYATNKHRLGKCSPEDAQKDKCRTQCASFVSNAFIHAEILPSPSGSANKICITSPVVKYNKFNNYNYLLPGDIIVIGSSSRFGHTAIYVGRGYVAEPTANQKCFLEYIPDENGNQVIIHSTGPVCYNTIDQVTRDHGRKIRYFCRHKDCCLDNDPICHPRFA